MQKAIVYMFVLFMNNLYGQDKGYGVYEIKKIDISTNLSEISSCFSEGNLYLYKTSEPYKANSEYYDLYKARIKSNGELSKLN